MQAVTTIGLDIAKSIFQVHGVDADGRVLIRRKLKRRYVMAFFAKLLPCLVRFRATVPSRGVDGNPPRSRKEVASGTETAVTPVSSPHLKPLAQGGNRA